VWLKPGREKSLRRRHPWVFSGAVGRLEGEAAPGATVDIVASSGDFLARGAWSPSSQIRARVWSFESNEAIDAAFFRRRLSRAVESRRRLALLDEHGACRLVFSESDGLPGLIVDRYGEFLVCQFSSAGAEAWRATIVEQLGELCGPRGIYERSEGGARHKEGLSSRRGSLFGNEPPAELEIVAGRVRFVVNIANGQKTGAYLDQQRNRERVAAHAHEADVLDAFSYTGGFAIACLKAGARRATLIDSSPDALELAKREAASNGVGDRCRFVAANVFDELRLVREAGERFDLVVLDPPSFATKVEGTAWNVVKGYPVAAERALALLAPGGRLLAITNHRKTSLGRLRRTLRDAAARAGVSVAQLKDLPPVFDCPDGPDGPVPSKSVLLTRA
jgi:23S rRNA (cytosine1962-C5)-methyltransferase